MTQAFTLWLGRIFPGRRAATLAPSREPQPLAIEVERLPDYLWRDLGFPQPRRPADDR